MTSRTNRRTLLTRGLSLFALTALPLAACAAPTPTAAPAKPTEAPKPTAASAPAAPATAAPAQATAAPAAAAPTAAAPVATKPAAAATTAAPSASASTPAAAASAPPAATAAGATAAIKPGQFAGKTLSVALAPGRIDDLNKIVTPEFEKLTGAKLQLTGLRSSDSLARARLEKDRPTLDVLWIDVGESELLAKEGITAKLTEAELPNLKNIRDNAKSKQGVAPIAFSSALGFLYNKEMVKTPPKAWADLWDPRFKKQLALFDLGSSVGVLTLIIAAKLAGGSEANIDPGFKKMLDLKANGVGFKTSGPENNNLVAQGEAGVTFALSGQTVDLKAKGANVDWNPPTDGAATLPQTFQVAAKSAQPELARAFADFVLSKEIQTRFANELLLAVTHKDVVLDPKVAPLVPLDNLQYFDWDIIGAKRGEWTNRFNREILGA